MDFVTRHVSIKIFKQFVVSYPFMVLRDDDRG